MTNRRTLLATLFCLAVATAPLVAEQAQDKPAESSGGKTFDQMAVSAREDLQESLEELTKLREEIAAEKLPLSRRLREAENRLVEVRAEHERLSRQLDQRNLELNNIRPEIDGRAQEKTYLSNLLDEYARNFETRVHITELQRYREIIDGARRASDAADLEASEVYAAQLALVDASLDRLAELAGGATFDGQAVDAGNGGVVTDVTFALVGPVAFYSAKDHSSAGLAEQRLGSLEPNMVTLRQPEHAAAIRDLIASGSGRIPFDPSLGNALRVEATHDSLVEHVKKGGVVMVPILLMAAAALIVALGKWVQIARIPNPSPRKLQPLLEAVKKRDRARAVEEAKSLRGPTGGMLAAGVEHMTEPKDLVEEVMFEKMLETRLRLMAWLPFVAMSASAAPLLGLLGTVTGMINTFKMITVFGSGDAKTLSSGISEALITTQFGLIVAIPSLLLYAYLSRRARRLIDGMEKSAVALLNRLGGKPRQPVPTGDTEGRGQEPTRSKSTGGTVSSPEPALAPSGAYMAAPRSEGLES